MGQRNEQESIRLIVGLGNPGEKYMNTRHNAGSWFLQSVARFSECAFKEEKKFFGKVATAKISDLEVMLLLPQTYMNESGLSVRKLMDRYSISEPSQLVVIHDELDLPVGKIKIKLGGGLAGHNGLKSIENHLHSREFARIRIGIGAIREGQRGRDFVLSRPSKDDRQALLHSKSMAVDALEYIQRHGYQAAMNKFNA